MRYIGALMRVRIRRGDVLVYLCSRQMSGDDKLQVDAALEKRFPGVPRLIVDEGDTLAVVNAEDLE